MYINITDSKTANNKGSSRELVHYLEKENRTAASIECEYWFNHGGRNIEPYEVRIALDSNIAKLCKTDSKFFLINISPSQKELKHLANEFGELELKEKLKIYAERLMDEYARNFKRDGISSAKDLVWFGKIENHRYYGYRDKEVIAGERKRGELKEGNQLHIQVIVSRKDVTNSIKLSPMNNSKGKNELHSQKLGQFNRVAFKQSREDLFDQEFGFDRQLKEKMAYSNILRNGSLDQRQQLDILEKTITLMPKNTILAKNMMNQILDRSFSSISDMSKKAGGIEATLLELLLAPANEVDDDQLEKELKRRKKKHSIDQGLSR